MLSIIARRSATAAVILPRAMVARSFGIADSLKGKVRRRNFAFVAVIASEACFSSPFRFLFFFARQTPVKLYMKQEKVEEDRYIREQEKMFFAKKKAEMADKLHGEEEKLYKETIAPAMAEAELVLKKAGATNISHEGLEAIAKWKLGMS
jgi:hypothetical protein